MSTFAANRARAVALELCDEAITLYLAVLPIFRASQNWTLNGLDPALPAPIELRAQVAAWRALLVPDLKLDAWGKAFLTAGPDDTLTYPPAPVLFDGGAGIFDGGGAPEEPIP